MTADQFAETVRDVLASGKRTDIKLHEIATALERVNGVFEAAATSEPEPFGDSDTPAVEGAESTVPLGLSTSPGTE